MRDIFSEYRVLIVDMDGTLYRAIPLKVCMALELAGYYVLHLWRVREFSILRIYRSLHNGRCIDGFSAANEQDCVTYVSTRFNVKEGSVRELVGTWMIDRPLKYLPLLRSRKLIQNLAWAQEQGVKVAVYSDYPTEKKVSVLMGLHPDCQFASTDKAIDCFKPCKSGIEYILKTMDASPEEALMVGDRDDTDGATARAVGMDYLIV